MLKNEIFIIASFCSALKIKRTSLQPWHKMYLPNSFSVAPIDSIVTRSYKDV